MYCFAIIVIFLREVNVITFRLTSFLLNILVFYYVYTQLLIFLLSLKNVILFIYIFIYTLSVYFAITSCAAVCILEYITRHFWKYLNVLNPYIFNGYV